MRPSLLIPILLLGTRVLFALDLVLPTDNKAILEGHPEDFYQFVDRTLPSGEKTTPWEAGQFGFVRNEAHLTNGETIFTRFHEGLDIKPMHRDAKDEPTDEVRSIAAGEVVYTSLVAGHSNYGKYVVIRHDWGEGPFCSLYAHLSEIKCAVGDKLAAGAPFAIMGHTGDGIDRRRSHTHVELDLFLSSRFGEWYDGNATSPNYHGNYNGMNLVGVNLATVYQAHAKDPNVSVAGLVKSAEPYFRVAVPGLAEMEILKNYPWLCATPVPSIPPQSWQITFTAWGLPIKIEPAAEPVTDAQVVWVKPSTSPHYSLSRHLLNGIGSTAKLSSDGEAYVRLTCGMENIRKAKPVISAKDDAPSPAKRKKRKA